MAKITNLPLFLISLVILGIYLKSSDAKSITFNEYKRIYQLEFSFFEDKFREQVFYNNIAKIQAHNNIINQTYKMGINQFTHLTQQEATQIYLGTIVKPVNVIVDQTFVSVQSVDWVTAGAVTRIKDQGDCGSCWAFSTTGSLQGLSKIAYGSLQEFSQQQLLDCSQDYGNFGCQGGLMSSAFDYVVDNKISAQKAYPYKAKVQDCKVSLGTFGISGYTQLEGCTNLANAIVARPISVGVDATNWFNYKSGIFNNCDTNINHGVLLVGITDSYWHVKNSWASTWGQKGYIRLSRGNTCGICYIPSYPKK